MQKTNQIFASKLNLALFEHHYAKRRSIFLTARCSTGIGNACWFCIFGTWVQYAIKPGQCAQQNLTDFAISAIAYFFVGYWIAYGQNFSMRALPWLPIMATT